MSLFTTKFDTNLYPNQSFLSTIYKHKGTSKNLFTYFVVLFNHRRDGNARGCGFGIKNKRNVIIKLPKGGML